MAALKKIAIVGPESSGKTFLAQALAAHYSCPWVPEYARTYLTPGKPYTAADVEQIARGQLALENRLVSEADSLLICDTNLLVIKVWMEHKFGYVPPWIDAEIRTRHYHLHLLTAPDIPYEEDPLRENPELGTYFFAQYETLLKTLSFPYIIICGTHRLQQAVKAVGKALLAG
ncbi:MAG: hypothetical protein KatS3mg031_1379 [Chitinophagales bacterium]|nr:MAG: hypothetical protein KatS3mg031_1379 [Chitinophagales bacterium]